jgi:hypothetical protein
MIRRLLANADLRRGRALTGEARPGKGFDSVEKAIGLGAFCLPFAVARPHEPDGRR